MLEGHRMAEVHDGLFPVCRLRVGAGGKIDWVGAASFKVDVEESAECIDGAVAISHELKRCVVSSVRVRHVDDACLLAS